MPRKIRRLVTGHDKDGRSIFLMDGEAQSILVIDHMGDLAVTDLWETFDAPADNSGEADNAAGPLHLEPGLTGTIFRTVEFPPDSTWQGAASLYMHSAASVDYAIVLKGEIWAVLDKDERLMREADVLIQRGTNHAWSNRSDQNCLMMFVLCGAHPSDTSRIAEFARKPRKRRPPKLYCRSARTHTTSAPPPPN